MIKNIIIDASIAAKWLIPDEQGNIAADRIKKELTDKVISITVPVFIFYEVNNLIKSAALSNRINPEKAKRAYEEFLDLGFNVHSSKELLKLTLEKAFELDISSYDASYVALAEYLKIPFYTADKKLVQKAGSELVIYLEKYPLSPF